MHLVYCINRAAEEIYPQRLCVESDLIIVDDNENIGWKLGFFQNNQKYNKYSHGFK